MCIFVRCPNLPFISYLTSSRPLSEFHLYVTDATSSSLCSKRLPASSPISSVYVLFIFCTQRRAHTQTFTLACADRRSNSFPQAVPTVALLRSPGRQICGTNGSLFMLSARPLTSPTFTSSSRCLPSFTHCLLSALILCTLASPSSRPVGRSGPPPD